MNGHEVALWASVAAFFGYLLATGIFDVLNVDQVCEYIGALLVAAITAGAVYSTERVKDAKARAAAPVPSSRKKLP